MLLCCCFSLDAVGGEENNEQAKCGARHFFLRARLQPTKLLRVVTTNQSFPDAMQAAIRRSLFPAVLPKFKYLTIRSWLRGVKCTSGMGNKRLRDFQRCCKFRMPLFAVCKYVQLKLTLSGWMEVQTFWVTSRITHDDCLTESSYKSCYKYDSLEATGCDLSLFKHSLQLRAS